LGAYAIIRKYKTWPSYDPNQSDRPRKH
jgi:hypothetical protein